MLRKFCPRGTVTAILGVAWIYSFVVGTVEAKAREIPCPNEADIQPCVCTAQPDFSMDMDCSAVTSSNQLALAFNADFPFPDFNNLFIINNTRITTLRVGDLGVATFQRITITDGSLETIVDTALINSYGTLVYLDLSRNALVNFPFDEIPSFEKLSYIDFQNNKLSSVPDIHSSSLDFLLLGYNPIGAISSSFLKFVPNLMEISLISAQLTSLSPGTFTGLSNLQVVHLEDNLLTTLLAGTIEVTGTSNIVHLNNNRLSTIEVDAIVGANYQVWVNNNELPELTEEVWRPLFDANIRLSARENPFICGCDIAWIVLDVTYLAHLVDDPTCSNGDYIFELDPSVFNELCS